MLDRILTFVRDTLNKFEEFFAADIIEVIRTGFEQIFKKAE